MKNLKLKAAHAALDLSQQDLADKVGVLIFGNIYQKPGYTLPGGA